MNKITGRKRRKGKVMTPTIEGLRRRPAIRCTAAGATTVAVGPTLWAEVTTHRRNELVTTPETMRRGDAFFIAVVTEGIVVG